VNQFEFKPLDRDALIGSDVRGLEKFKTKQEPGVQRFSSNELGDYSEEELLNLLKQQWGYREDEPFELIGRLKKIPTESGGFYVLENLHSLHDGSVLLYPLEKDGVRHTVFVGILPNDTPHHQWFRARVQLSPPKERKKHDNPFALKVVNEALQPLEEVPEKAVNAAFTIDGQAYLEKWILDTYRAKHQKEIEDESALLREQLNRRRNEEEERITSLTDQAQKIDQTLKQQTQSLDKAKDELSNILEEKKSSEAELKQKKATMEHQLSTLTKFIEEKTRILIDLDLVDKAELEHLNGGQLESARQPGHGFAEVFDSDISEAISYIQAHLYQQGVVYRRSVLEDFYALLTTHDLIILAGDSGSGKTNLVKSFASAIGGKSVVVPVKPNWTSAEDLLGYYNPIEQKYLPTPFLEALLEAERNPTVPYLICLDEMNLARVEYYFADFLSLMEERNSVPEIPLYSQTEAQNLQSEARNFLALIDEVKVRMEKPDLVSFLDLLRDDEVNAKLHELSGFREGDSLLRYHARLRKLLNSYLTTPSSLRLPANVRIIGAINVDETTHYLSPKILDRAHVMRFSSPLLADWGQIDEEIEDFDVDTTIPLEIDVAVLGNRQPYPEFDRDDSLVGNLLTLVKDYLDPLGVEFGLRTVRQACHYRNALSAFSFSNQLALNNIVLHKVMPKLMFDGEKPVSEGRYRKDILLSMRDFLDGILDGFVDTSRFDHCLEELDRVIQNARSEDWVVNYWAR